MTTDVESKAPAPAGEVTAGTEGPHVAGAIDDNRELLEEIERLVELTRYRIDRDEQTPCPSCNIPVDLQNNRCPHCESDIAAHNALVRESARRLGEIEGELDGQSRRRADRDRKATAGRSLGERIKRLFSGSGSGEEREPNIAGSYATAPRILGEVSPGDQLTVLDSDGPWFKVKTRQGKTGWVFSTLVYDK